MAGERSIITTSFAWTDPSKFKISFTGAGASFLSIDGMSDILTSSCLSIQLADISADQVEEWSAEEWKFMTGRLSSYLISISLKDFDNFTLYKKFSKGIQDFMRMYPDEQKMNLLVESTSTFGEVDFLPICEFKDCMLVTVSGPTLDHSSVASIGQFTITLKSSYVETH